MNPKVTIIGAGLVGSLWAVLLRQRNFDVTVFEKRPDMRKSGNDTGRSINLVITSRGMHALETAGLLDRALALSVPVYGRMIHSKAGELTYQAYGKENERNLSISRSELNKFLLNEAEAVGAKVHFEHTLSTADFEKKNLVFTNGKANAYDLLFGTDGAGSLIRKNLVQQFPDLCTENSTWISADYKELFMPAPNDLDKKSLHIWPRGSHMMMALANLDGSQTVTLYLPKTGPVSFEKIKTRSEIETFFKNEFPDAIALMPDYVSEFENNPQGALGTVRCSNWIFGDSVALMGDAAHAIVPFFGQGMNSGFEDCTNLLKILDQHRGNWTKAFTEYNETQPPNANAIADMAIENWHEMSEKVADPKFQLRKKAEALVEKHFPEIFKSRYGMVTYTLIPYDLVQKAGYIHDEIFAELLTGVTSVDEVSIEKASELLQRKYVPFTSQPRFRS
ncbi:MAG: FAD-dependent monooxygenase [Bdellovibrionaceae bacterium]|nr:FAD-dependent monooxygenase [Pseudobdellovibrionaceae bacterium]